MRERSDIGNGKRRHIVLEPNTDPTRLDAQTKQARLGVERASLAGIDDLHLRQLTFGQGELAETPVRIAIDEVPERPRLDLKQRDRIGMAPKSHPCIRTKPGWVVHRGALHA